MAVAGGERDYDTLNCARRNGRRVPSDDRSRSPTAGMSGRLVLFHVLRVGGAFVAAAALQLREEAVGAGYADDERRQHGAHLAGGHLGAEPVAGPSAGLGG